MTSRGLSGKYCLGGGGVDRMYMPTNTPTKCCINVLWGGGGRGGGRGEGHTCLMHVNIGTML